MQHSRRANHIPHELTTKHHHVWGFPQLISSRGNPSPTASHNRQDDSDAGHSNLPSSAFDCSWNGGWEQDGPGLASNSIFFSLLSGKKIIYLLGEQINAPNQGGLFSLSFLPATPLSGSWTFELYELKDFMSCHSLLRGPLTVLSLLPELQRCKGTIRCIRARRGGPRTP